MAWVTDSLRTALAAFRGIGQQAPAMMPIAFNYQLALAAYMASGMLRKVIAIPADDRVREWRDWQAEKAQIALIEAEEKRLGLLAKVGFAERLRGIGGGAIILVTAGNHGEPLMPDAIRKGGLLAVNVVSRWQIQGEDWVRDLASPEFGHPKMFSVTDGRAQQKIHPSRVVCFRGDPLPAGPGISDEDAFWGDSRLLRVFSEVQKSDNAHLWFTELVKKAKLLRIGIPDLDKMDQDRIDKRIAMIASCESVLNATVYRSSGGTDDAGEKIDDYQISWTGIPGFMDALDQRVAAVADIPFTRLMGRSPAGLNATGEHDSDNWNKMVASGQNLETRPCLDQLDPVMLRSAGVDPGKITWSFAPLDIPTEKESADTFKTGMEAIEKLQNTGTIPDEAFAKGVQNWMIEREYMPGLDQALSEIPEAERYGLAYEELPEAANENHIAEMEERGAINADQARALLTDARPRSLYVRRDVVNVDEIKAWANGQGLPELQDGLHVTLIYSEQPVDWMKIEGEDWNQEKDGTIEVPPGGVRIVEPLGDRTAVLLFTASRLSWRHEQILRAGAQHGFESYQPHISLTGEQVDLAGVEPYRGRIVLGPEVFEEIRGGGPEAVVPFVDARRRGRGRRGTASSSVRGFNPNQPRGPGGRWIETGASGQSGSVASHVRRALTNKTEHSRTSLGQVSQANANLVFRQTGHSIAGHERVIESSDIRHVMKSHGNPVREAARGQVAIARADFGRITEITEQAHTVRLVGSSAGRKGLRIEYTAALGAREYRYVEQVRPNGQIVALKSMLRTR